MLFENILTVQKWPIKYVIYKFRGKCVRYRPKHSLKITVSGAIFAITPLAWPIMQLIKNSNKKMPFDVSITM